MAGWKYYRRRDTAAEFNWPRWRVNKSRSQWPRGLRHEMSSPAWILWSWVRITLEAWMFVCVYSVFVLSCVSSSLATGWSLVQGVLPIVYKCEAVYAHCEDASRGVPARQDSRNGYLPRPCACLVWRQPRGEPTPVGFLTCSKVPRCELLALTGLPRVLLFRMVASHACLDVLKKDIWGIWRLRQPREAFSQCAYTA
jgi:hypothetical protein